MSSPAIQLMDVEFAYRSGNPILQIPHFQVERGERLFLLGPSGSGKTTLLGLLAGVLTAQTGSVRVLDTDLRTIPGAKRDRFRGDHIGYIFQLFNLLPYLSAIDNITLPCRFHAARRKRLNGSLESAARTLAERLNIAELLHEKAAELSVGQQQRVAAARALLGSPDLLIADEPTSALDYDHRERFVTLLFECCRDAGATLVFVSHDRSLIPLFDRVESLPDLNRIPSRAA
jgi:putative ABC transport system ATP-binding protein